MLHFKCELIGSFVNCRITIRLLLLTNYYWFTKCPENIRKENGSIRNFDKWLIKNNICIYICIKVPKSELLIKIKKLMYVLSEPLKTVDELTKIYKFVLIPSRNTNI